MQAFLRGEDRIQIRVYSWSGHMQGESTIFRSSPKNRECTQKWASERKLKGLPRSSVARATLLGRTAGTHQGPRFAGQSIFPIGDIDRRDSPGAALPFRKAAPG